MRKMTKLFGAIFNSHKKNYLYDIKLLIILMFSIACINSTGYAAPAYVLDPAFGDLGRVVLNPDGATAAAAYGMALQTDGKIIMVGSSNANAGLFVARFNTNGSLDTTFGTNGWTTAAFETGGYAVSVDIQPDGKIVVGGTVSVNNNYDFAVARFNADGSLDTSFDGDGKTTVSFNDWIPTGITYNEYLNMIKVGSDGKIILAGVAKRTTVDDRLIFARLESNGAVDMSFGSGRVVNEPYTTNLDRVTDIIVLPDGKFVATARLTNVCCNYRLAIKFNVNGTREWTYQQGLTQSFGYHNGFDGIAALPDGKFIVTGNRDGKIVAQRLNADGTNDTTFGVPSLISGQAISVALQQDGKFVTNWMVSNGYADQRNSFNLMRFNANGTLDAGFGDGGMINAAATVGLDYGQKVFVQPDGRILIGGYSAFGTRYFFSMMRYQANTTAPNNAQFDYDGDGKSDISVYRPSNGGWYLNRSANGFLGVQFGISTDRIVPADYDGDGKTDLAIYRDGAWWIFQSANNAVRAYQFGITEDKPQAGDFDGDGRDDLAVFRPSNGTWYILKSGDFKFYGVPFGVSTDIPQSADYDGDGKTDIAVFRPFTGEWFVLKSTGGYTIKSFGLNGDKPVANDYDGDGKTDLAVWRPSNGNWMIFRSSDNQTNIVSFGMSGDLPSSADYDGDGKADIAVFRPSNGGWYQIMSSQGYSSQVFGLSDDRPTPNAYTP